MLFNQIFYTFKPLIPRAIQICLRRWVVGYKRRRHHKTWPINPKAGNLPQGWKGWPDGKKFALVLSHDVDTRAGYDNVLKLADIEESLGFRSSFNFVPERYGQVSQELISNLQSRGFEVAVHGLKHDGRLFSSRRVFYRRANRINEYLKQWKTRGFTAPSMHHNLDWLKAIDIDYSLSTFDTDPFEPQPDPAGTIFPFWVSDNLPNGGFVELPYTLPQDSTLFIMLQETSIDIWLCKLRWIAEKGGMVLVNTHPDYMKFTGSQNGSFAYPVEYYVRFLHHLRCQYQNKYWHQLPSRVSRFWSQSYKNIGQAHASTILASQTEPNSAFDHPSGKQKVWIDLDNSPHIPFFAPIIEELKKQGLPVHITARDSAQTCEMADLYKMHYRCVGRHYGKNKLVKVLGTIYRGFQLLAVVYREKPTLAVSHGSRSQMLSAWIMGIPFVLLADYQHARFLPFIKPTKILIPEVIPESSMASSPSQVVKYPGIKEDVYVPNFKPNPGIIKELRLDVDRILVTVRPPAVDAHYHRPESEKLFGHAMAFLLKEPETQIVILPRNKSQASSLKEKYKRWVASRRIVIPAKAIDGLSLMWHSDLVISGGGTMNREAAALNLPVYSIFRGEIGSVDKYLAASGRLIMIESMNDIQEKVALVRRVRPSDFTPEGCNVLKLIVENLTALA